MVVISGSSFSVREEIDKICQANFDLANSSRRSSINMVGTDPQSQESLHKVQDELQRVYLTTQSSYQKSRNAPRNDVTSLFLKQKTLAVSLLLILCCQNGYFTRQPCVSLELSWIKLSCIELLMPACL